MYSGLEDPREKPRIEPRRRPWLLGKFGSTYILGISCTYGDPTSGCECQIGDRSANHHMKIRSAGSLQAVQKCAQVCSRLGVPRNSWNGWSFQVLGKNLMRISQVPHAMQFDNLFPTERVFSDPDPSTFGIHQVYWVNNKCRVAHENWFLLFLGHHSIKRLKSKGGVIPKGISGATKQEIKHAVCAMLCLAMPVDIDV